MKFVQNIPVIVGFQSLPSRGAWIEIIDKDTDLDQWIGRSPHGERGLKFVRVRRPFHRAVVAPLTGSVD